MDFQLPFSISQHSLNALAGHPTLVVGTGILVLAYLAGRYLSSPWRRLPPGPKGYPILGSAPDMLNMQRFLARSVTFGKIVYVNIVGQPTVIINSQRVATDLLDRRAATFSGRPRTIVGQELYCGGLSIVMLGHTDRWRRMRRAIHEGLRPAAAAQYHAMEAEEVTRLVLALANDKNASVRGGYIHHYARYAASLVLAITYDRPVRDTAEDRAMAKVLDEILTQLEAATAPGSHLVEFAKWKRDAQEGYVRITKFYDGLIDEVQKRMTIGEARPCLVRTLVEEKQHFGLSDLETSWAAGMMYTVGSDTQAATVEWITLALATHPKVQRCAQAELDTVIGHARSPRVGDRDQLPYVTAVFREVMRWRPAAPYGIPHVSEEDDWYEDMFIPKGTICMVNMMACNMDTEIYGADAALFNPDRYLDEKGRLKPSPPETKDEGHISYGFGRRVCIGRHVANDTLFMATAMLLWAFDLSTIGEYELDTYVDKGVTNCNFTPRFPEAMTILAAELDAC
ncbi:cytochrome P450 [Vararia minispora EC-137]|uniref:Cytochrome P450 n=1 Tax=Vararia minispora EC-137 TaxID=1314806 RepID=A0ACB8Q7G6_9AGAM|nr:cytochrome P450 [Vararia minispora EC-137]